MEKAKLWEIKFEGISALNTIVVNAKNITEATKKAMESNLGESKTIKEVISCVLIAEED